jgi:hypothetical protein
VTHEGHHHVDQAVCGLAARHDVRGKDEHRHRDQRRGPDPGEELLHHRLHLGEAVEQHVEADEGPGDERDHHREAEQKKNDHD